MSDETLRGGIERERARLLEHAEAIHPTGTQVMDDETFGRAIAYRTIADRLQSLLAGGPELPSAVLVALSRWINSSPGYVGCSPETILWRRVSKASVEANEALDALSGMVGENPRKGVYATQEDVIRELLDTATAALGAVEHLTGHKGEALARLDRHIISVGERAGLIP